MADEEEAAAAGFDGADEGEDIPTEEMSFEEAHDEEEAVAEENIEENAEEAENESDNEDNKETEEKSMAGKPSSRNQRIFAYPIIPSDLNEPKLKKFFDKASLVTSRFIGIKGGNKRGHIVLWYNTPEETHEMAEELKTVQVGSRLQPLKVVVSSGVTVPIGTIMEEWQQLLSQDDDKVAKTRVVEVKNIAPGTPLSLMRVLFPVALTIDMPEDEEGKTTGTATLIFENKTDAEMSVRNAKGIRIQDYELELEFLLTDEEKQEEEKKKKEAEEKEKEKAEKESKETEEEKKKPKAKSSHRRDRESDSEDDNNDDYGYGQKRKSSTSNYLGDGRKRGRFGGRSRGQDYYRGGGGGGRRGQWRGGGGFGGGGYGGDIGYGGDGGLMGLLNTLQQVQQMQHHQPRGGRGKRW